MIRIHQYIAVDMCIMYTYLLLERTYKMFLCQIYMLLHLLHAKRAQLRNSNFARTWLCTHATLIVKVKSAINFGSCITVLMLFYLKFSGKLKLHFLALTFTLQNKLDVRF